jgi:hypothetical protein
MKITSRIAFSVAVIAVATLASVATAQQKGKGKGGFGGFGFGGGDSLVTTAASEDVQKDLGVSGDLVAKINSLRDDLTAARQKEYQTAGISPQDFRNMTNDQRQKMAEINTKLSEEFNSKVKALVSADQYKRLQQIQLQAGLAGVRFNPAVLTGKDVATELALAEDQRQKLIALAREFGEKQRDLFSGGNFDVAASAKLREDFTAKTMEVLNDTQKEKLKTLKGPEFDVSKLGFGGGRRGKGN